MRGPRGKRAAVKLDPDGVPIDRRDWTEADWADLHYGVAAIKARIAARHAQSRESDGKSRESEAQSREQRR